MHRDRLEDIVGALIDIIEKSAVAPDLGIKGRAARRRKCPRPSIRRRRSAPGCPRSGRISCSWHCCRPPIRKGPGWNMRPLMILTFRRTVRTLGETPRTCTLASVPVERSGKGATTTTSESPGRRSRAPRPAHPGGFDRIQGNAAHHFGSGAGAHDDGLSYEPDEPAWRGTRGPAKHGNKDADGSGNAQHGHDGGGPPGSYTAQVVDDRYRP